MKKYIKCMCLLMAFAFMLQGCGKDKTQPGYPDAGSAAPVTQASAVTDPGVGAGADSTAPPQKNIPGLTYVQGILIVNKSYSLPATYDPGVDPTAQSALDTMIEAAAAEGIELFVVSGFRSYATQESLYNDYVAKDGKEEADRYSARPGHSEHQTGLAFDLNSLSQSFEETPEGIWLAENCYKYGFIIRFPKDKENITGYMYEPWHVRYLGISTAAAVYNSGLTLEEYLGINSVYAY